jgi:hypothetical protein
VTAPAAVPGAEWSAASELAEVEKLAEMGVVLRPIEPTVKGKGKAKAITTPAGHIVFAEDEAECESGTVLSCRRARLTNSFHSQEASEHIDFLDSCQRQRESRTAGARPGMGRGLSVKEENDSEICQARTDVRRG